MAIDTAPTTTPIDEDTDRLVEVRNLKMYFPVRRGLLIERTVGHVHAVDDVTFHVKRGETLGLVGESGCGKSTTGRAILQIYKPTDGAVNVKGVDITKLGTRDLIPYRRNMQMIFQDPFASLDPRMTVGGIIAEPLEIHNLAKGKEKDEKVREMLRIVGLNPYFANRYPHEFSGGQRQRIGVARALVLDPEFIVCDEPISALDVSIQAQIINLLEDLQERYNLTYLFIAHDLAVVRHISDRVAVMYVGKIVELAERDELFNHPKHPYTSALLSAVPKPDPRARSQRTPLQGEVANPAAPPSGCYFHPRCPYAVERCRTEAPVWEEIRPGHFVRCHRAAELRLPGIGQV